MVTLVGGGVDGNGAVPVVHAGAEDGTHGVVVGGQGEFEGVDGEGGGEEGVLRDGEGALGISAAVAPLHEVVVGGRGGGDGNVAADDNRAGRGADGTPLIVGAQHGDGAIVRVGGEEGGEEGVGGEDDLTRIVGYIVVPSHEVVTLVGGGVDGNGAVPVVHAGAEDGTHGVVVGGQGEFEGVDGEGGGEEGVLRDGEGALGISAAVAPLHEVVVGSGGSGNGDGLVVGVGVAAGANGNGTHGLVGRLGVDVQLACHEVGGIDMVGDHLLVEWVGSDVAGSPVEELEAVLGRSLEGNKLAVGILAAGDSGIVDRPHGEVGRHDVDGEAVDGEDGGEGGVGGEGEAVGGVGLAVAPLAEGAVAEGHGLEVDGAAVRHLDRLTHDGTVHIAKLAVIDIDGQIDAVDGEVGHIGGALGGEEGRQVHIGGDRHAVERPVHEVVVDRGGNAEADAAVVGIGAGTDNGGGVGGHDIDGNAVNLEGGAEGGVGIGHILARVGGNAVAPGHEVVVVGGRGIEGGGRAVHIAAGAGKGAVADGREGHGVGVGGEGGDEQHIATADGNGADAVGNAVAPSQEVAVRGGTCREGVRAAVGHAGGAAEGGAQGGAVGQGRDAVFVGLGEDGADKEVAFDLEDAACIGAGILPTDEAVEVVVMVDIGDGNQLAVAIGSLGGREDDVAHQVVVGGGVEGVGKAVEAGGQVEVVGGNGEHTGVVVHAVAPLGEGHAGIGGSPEHYARIIYICAVDFGVDRTEGSIGGKEAHLEAVAGEDGGIGAVAVVGHQAVGSGLAVIPAHEVAVLVGHGLDTDGAGAEGTGAAAGDITHIGVVGHHTDGVLQRGGEGHIVGGAVDHDGAGVDDIAVVPAYKAVVGVGGGGDGNGGAVGIAAAAGGGSIVTGNADRHVGGGEEGGDGGVGADADADGGEGAVGAVPTAYILAGQRGGGEGNGGVVGEAAATVDIALGGVGRQGGNGVGLGGEEGLQGRVATHDHHTVVAGVAVVPADELVMLGGVGGEHGHLVQIVGGLVAVDGAPAGMVGGEADHETALLVEVGHDVGTRGNRPVEGGERGAVDAPVGELVARGVDGRGDGGDDVAVMVVAVDGGGKHTHAEGGGNGNVVEGLRVVGREGGVGSSLEGVDAIGAHHGALGVGPVGEAPAGEGVGGEGNDAAVDEVAADRGGAVGCVVRGSGDGHGHGGEVGGVALVAGNRGAIGVVGGAVVPADEHVAVGGDGLEVGHGAEAVGGGAVDRAHGGVGREARYGVHVGLEVGGIGARGAVGARGHDGLGGGVDAVAPAVEGVVLKGGGGDGDAVAYGHADAVDPRGGADDGHGATVDIRGLHLDGDAVADEDGTQGFIAIHIDSKGVCIGIGIATPLDELGVAGGLRHQCNIIAILVFANTDYIAESSVEVGYLNSELGGLDDTGDNHALGACGEGEGVGVAADRGGAHLGIPAEGVVVGVVDGGGDGNGLSPGNHAAGGRGGDGAEERVVEGAEDHGLVLGAEIGDEGGVAADGVVIAWGGGAVAPADELVARIGGGGEGQDAAVGMAAGMVADRAEEGVDGVDGDGVAIRDKLGHIGGYIAGIAVGEVARVGSDAVAPLDE